MTWLKDILFELAKKVTAKNAFILLMTATVFTGVYFLADRFFDYKEAVNLDQPKRVIKNINTMKEYGVSYNEFAEYNNVQHKPKKAE